MKSGHAIGLTDVAKIDGRPVLQPACNRVAAVLEPSKPMKKSLQRSLSSPMSITITKTSSTNISDLDANSKASPTAKKKTVTPPISPKPKPIKRSNDPYSPNSSSEKPITQKLVSKPAPVVRKKSKKSTAGNPAAVTLEKSSSFNNYSYESLLVDRAPGSIAAAQREQASLMQAQRKMRIAHYGRTPEKLEKVAPVIDTSNVVSQEEKRCSFITPNSGNNLIQFFVKFTLDFFFLNPMFSSMFIDPLYVAYHDEEWGVPVHDDK